MDEREQLNNTIGRKSQAIEEISRARKKEEKQQAKIKKKTYLTSREIQKYSKIEKNYSGQEKKTLVAMEDIFEKKKKERKKEKINSNKSKEKKTRREEKKQGQRRRGRIEGRNVGKEERAR